MEQSMKTRWIKKMGEKGFTLMELLIVIVILGFLIGMIAPRLSSIIDDSVIDNVCDSNNKGMRTYVNMFLQKKSRLPNDMINLVNNNAGVYTIPSTSNGDSTDGPESFAGDFVSRNDPTLYALSLGEVAEIKSSFGISHVRNLNQELKAADAFDAPYERVELAAAVSVAMIGASETDTALGIPANMDDLTDDYPMGNPNWLGRIILGVGKHSELVTGGYIQAAALCPGGIQAADNVAYNNYCLILPRLDATLDIIGNVGAGDLKGVELTFVDAEDANGETMVFTMEAQEAWQFEFTCPEGHKWPDNDNDNWVYSSGL